MRSRLSSVVLCSVALLPLPSYAGPVDLIHAVCMTFTAKIFGIVLLFIASLVLLSVYLLPHWLLRCIEWNSHPSVLWSASTSSRVCSLTIDDAPSSSTPAILDILHQHNVKATFFIISDHIPGNEEVLRRIVQEGHALANHLTDDRASILDELHVFEKKLQECDRAINKFQPAVSETSLIETEQLLLEEKELDPVQVTKAAGPRSKWMRPASGWFTTPMREIAARHGYRICLGNVYPHDAQIRSETMNSMHLQTRTSCGSVIIVHDRSWTIGVLKTALPVLTSKFTFVSLDKLVSYHEGKAAKTDAAGK
ncbi:unnamed protein product [Peronospora destructor]|uniref:NodB homology domain-containing protein n=1 Tax=Peronospora destructor TaxID=86335 RepID=A0AAV0TDG3_9STRA|nr:unnamed protein product [Peronospora destructor]